MAHPFFDEVTYPWEIDDATTLHTRLYLELTVPTQINNIYRSCGSGLMPLALNDNSYSLWTAVLDNLAARTLLSVLCSKLKNGAYSNHLKKAVEAVINAKPIEPAKLPAKSLDNTLILDCIDLRPLIEKIQPDETPCKTLLVRGEPDSGKSWSYKLFLKMARSQGASITYVTDGTIDEVGEKLFSVVDAQATWESIRQRDTTSAAWYKRIVNYLKTPVKSKTKPLWVVFDNLGKDRNGVPLLNEEVRLFCNQFAKELQDAEFAKWFRLILIHLPGR